MKSIVKTLLIISVVAIFGSANAETNMLYTEKGYPYKDLVNRSNEVKIIYSENKSKVVCRVEVDMNGTVWQSPSNDVTKTRFEQTPLSSCLPRERAKQILASSF